MPLYEYRCDKCGNVFEVMQKFSEEPLTRHEGCGGAVERLLSAPALQFKGTGWYITDYARAGKGGKTDGAPKEGGSKDADSSKPDSNGSSKTKTETKSTSDSTKASSSTSESK
jgi:putative FmdB family regulatory protein